MRDCGSGFSKVFGFRVQGLGLRVLAGHIRDLILGELWVVLYFCLANFICRILKGNPQRELKGQYW